METVNSQLKRLREEAGLSLRALAEAIGMPTTSYAAYEDIKKFKKRYLPLDLAQKIAVALSEHNIEPDRVLTLAGMERGGAALQSQESVARQMGFGLVPELELGYSMGGGAIFNDYRHIGVVPFPIDWLRRLMSGTMADLFVARGEGDSMQPTLLDGDVVLIDTAQRQITKQDRIWAISYGDLGMIKRVRRLPDGSFSLMSDNAAVSDVNAFDDEMHVIGRVIWIGRKM